MASFRANPPRGGRLAAATSLLLLFLLGWSGAADRAWAQGPQFTYQARLSARDHFNSAGERLKTAAEVIRQDRANYHRYGRRDPEDTGDPVFSDPAARASLDAQRVKFGNKAVADAVLNGTPLVEVEIWGDVVQVTLL